MIKEGININLRLPSDLLKRIDEYADRDNYPTRSAAIRDLLEVGLLIEEDSVIKKSNKGLEERVSKIETAVKNLYNLISESRRAPKGFDKGEWGEQLRLIKRYHELIDEYNENVQDILKKEFPNEFSHIDSLPRLSNYFEIDKEPIPMKKTALESEEHPDNQ